MITSDSDAARKEGRIYLQIMGLDRNKIENNPNSTLIRRISVLFAAVMVIATLYLFLLCSTLVYAGDNFLDFEPCKKPMPIDSCKVSVSESGNFVFATNPDPDDISMKLNIIVEKNLNKKVADIKAGIAVGYNYGLLDGGKGAIKDSGKYGMKPVVTKTSSDFKAGFKSGYNDGYETGKAFKHVKKMESHSK